MRCLNKKILFVHRERFTFLIDIADFSSQECYGIYFQFSLKDPWWIPRHKENYLGKGFDLTGWLFFYFGRKSFGVIIPAAPGETTSAQKPIYDRAGQLWKLYTFPDEQMAKEFKKTQRKHKTNISVECKDGEYTIVCRVR